MLKLTKTGIGLLTRQYRSVLKKCWLINVGLFALSTVFLPRDASAEFGFLNAYSTGRPGWGAFAGGGYNNYFEYRSSNSSSFAMAEKPGGSDHQLSIQIDGYFYQNEGSYRVLDTSDIISSVTSGSGKVVTSGAVYSALSGYATKSTTLSGYGITNAYTKNEVDNLISGSGSSYTAGTGISLANKVISLDSNYLDNNYYRKDEKSGILNGFESGEIGNENDDNFSKFRAVNGDFASKNGDFVAKNPSRLGAFAKCEKACPRPSERKGVTANSAFEFNRQNVASTDAGTTLNNWRQFKAVMDNLSQCHADNGGFVLKNLSRLGAFSKCEKACPRPSERFPASLEKNSAFEQYSRSARGTFLFGFQPNKNVMDSFYKNSQCLKASNDNFATTTFLRAI